MIPIQQSFSVSYQYEVIFTNNLFHPGNPVFSKLLDSEKGEKPAKVFFVVDKGVAETHPLLQGRIINYCNSVASDFHLTGPPLIIEGGENVKNRRDYLDKILCSIEENGLCRHSYLAVIGGGAVLDMAGFAAAIAHRGIRLIRIPTTVLAQNDSGVGVKNGINAFGKKNFLGTFYPPYVVINDFNFLQTLSDKDYRSGISEAVKVALLKDPGFFKFIEYNACQLNSRNQDVMKILIHRCAELHMEHISGGDPFEAGSSRPLDFGHWAAHKLEQLSGCSINHGEAVAAGIALDCAYAYLIKLLSKEDLGRILSVLKQVGFKLFFEEMLVVIDERNALLNGINEFREHLGGRLTIMLLEEIGKGKEVHQISEDIMLQAIKLLKEYELQPADFEI
ncbi:MAG: 3-dehydroquinate synthase [Cytophagaceae bacterium]